MQPVCLAVCPNGLRSGTKKVVSKGRVGVSFSAGNFQTMKRIYNHTILLLVLLAIVSAGTVSAQDRGRAGRRATPAQAKPKPTPSPSPTPVPVQTIAETPLQPGQRARFDVNNYRIIAEL